MGRQPQPGHDLDDARETAPELRGDRQRDRIEDRVGDLPSDPSGGSPASDLKGDLSTGDDDDEVWFEADELAEASSVELGPREDAGILQGASLVRLSRPRAGVSLARLPGWPGADGCGQGLGDVLGALVGELRPGDVVALTGAQRGVGRSSVLAQLSDGLALRSATIETPVVCAVEGSARLWRARSFARWSGLDARVLLDGSFGTREADLDGALARFADSPWSALDGRQRFVDVDALRDEVARRELLAALRRWRGELQRETSADAVWPVLVVDPLEQLGADPLAVLAELEALAQEEALLVLLSCDDPAAVDSRRFDRCVGVRLHATAPAPDALELELRHRRLGPGGRVRLSWDRATGRITSAPA